VPVQLPARVSSPGFDASAPFTPTVVSLLRQLEPNQPDPVHDTTPALGTTIDQLINAGSLLHGGGSCTVVGHNDPPTGTNPAIAPLCWADAMGVNVTSGAQIRQTTAPPIRPAMSSSWDPNVLNAWGQVQGEEGRQLGITGIYGPQVDLLRIPAWGRNVAIFGEDPFQDGTMAAGEVNGTQGKGLMSQVKHFAMYNGQTMDFDTKVQDQASHELYLTPYEYGANGSGVLPNAGFASSLMCSYQIFEIQPAPGVTGGPSDAFGPSPGGALACDHNIKNYVARNQWGWQGFFASDYGAAMDSTKQAIDSGTDQEMPTSVFFGPALALAVKSGAVSLATFNRAIARILYQEERFHLLGHPDANSNYLSSSNPTETTGKSAITPEQKAAHAATTEKAAEEGAVLLKNDSKMLPLTRGDLNGGVLVVGESAEYMPAGPGIEAAQGYPDRDAISPLEQLKQFAPAGSKITYLPYLPGAAPTVGDGVAVPKADLSTDGTTIGNGLTRTAGPGAPTTDAQVDFTSVSGHGQLEFGKTYTWKGYVNVPKDDDYTFHFEFSVPGYSLSPGQINNGGSVTQPSCTSSGAPTFSLATAAGAGGPTTDEQLSSSGATLNGVQTNPTMSGYTDRGLASCLYHAGSLSAGVHQIQINWTTPAAFDPDTYHLREPGSNAPSFRFAYSRTNADRADAIAAAKGASKVLVFGDCNCPAELGGGSGGNVNSLDANTVDLTGAMAKANPKTGVVMNVDVATLMPWLDSVKSALLTWYPGSEGGTATARLLLGEADPGGHLTSTWPAHGSDTIWAYDEKVPLYAGETTGTHPERLSSTPPVDFSEGIFVGYRFFDREGIKPLFPFGWGLSYTTFRFSHLALTPRGGGVDVGFDVTNTGSVAGAAAPQVYLGPAPSVPAGVQQAVRSLGGFDRVVLAPRQTKHETIHLGPGTDVNGHGDRRAFQYWSTPSQAWVTAPGARRVWVGDADDISRLPLSGSTSGSRANCTPQASFARASIRAARRTHAGRRLSVRGSARARTGCAAIRKVQVSVARRVKKKRCRYLTSRGGFSRPSSCQRPRYLGARGRAHWRFKSRIGLPRGTYTVRIRSIDSSGKTSPVSRRAKTLLQIRLR
jgi:beta-glucosidase